jgi:hypothetical protein
MALYKYDSTSNKLIPITSEGSVGLPVGAVLSFPAGTTQAGWLLCDGSTFDRTVYPALYTYLGSNVLPDYRECVLVGAGQNDTDTIATHDVYNLGEFKDDQLQDHKHNAQIYWATAMGNNHPGYGGSGRWESGNVQVNGVKPNSARYGTTTHGKQKGVAYYIKATSAGPEVEPDIYATKGYIRDQNVLSEWEAITIPTSAATAITMDYDGELYICIGTPNGTYIYIYINGVSFNIGESPSSAGGNNITNFIPVKKGDVVYVSKSPLNAKVAYYKLRDYTGR